MHVCVHICAIVHVWRTAWSCSFLPHVDHQVSLLGFWGSSFTSSVILLSCSFVLYFPSFASGQSRYIHTHPFVVQVCSHTSIRGTGMFTHSSLGLTLNIVFLLLTTLFSVGLRVSYLSGRHFPHWSISSAVYPLPPFPRTVSHHTALIVDPRDEPAAVLWQLCAP